MDYKKLIGRLKKETYWSGSSGAGSRDIHPVICDEAADAIAKLLERAERAEKQLAESEPKHGHWEEIEDDYGGLYYQCSNCGDEWTLIDGTPKENNMNYCPRCGAKMVEGDQK